MNVIGEAVGHLCKIILPISEEYYLGNPESSIGVCTLSSMDLLKKFANSEILTKISVAGRLLSENKGIDAIVRHVNRNPQIHTVVVCGKDTWGHRPGHSLFELHKNGIDQDGRIINSSSPDPYLTVSASEIRYFQDSVCLVDMIGQTDFELILKNPQFPSNQQAAFGG